MSEKDIENAILEYLNLLPNTKAWKNQSVGIYDPVKKIYRMNKGAYTARGTSDIIGICNGVMLCIEVKTPKGKPTKLQLEFLSAMEQYGALAMIARSVDDVKYALAEVDLLDW